MAQVTIHSKDGCPYCEKAKAWLTENSVQYQEVKHNDFEERNAFYDKLGLEGSSRSVPQIFLDEERIGGYSDLISKEAYVKNKLASGQISLDEDF